MKKSLTVAIAVLLAVCGYSTETGAEDAQSHYGLVSYWKFDDGAGTTAKDSAGENTAQLGDSEGNRPMWVLGISGYALDFDGVDDFVKVQDHPSLDIRNAITVEAWVKFDNNNPDGGAIILTKNWDGVNAPFHFTFENNDWMGIGPFFGVTASSRWHYVGVSGRPYVGQWYHLAGTFDGTVMRLFMNGIEIGSTPWDGSILPNDFPLSIGAQTDWHWRGRGGGTVDGIIDEVAIYNRALTAWEIERHYRNGIERGAGYLE